MPLKTNTAIFFGAEVITEAKQPITAPQARAAILDRLIRISDDELLEAIDESDSYDENPNAPITQPVPPESLVFIRYRLPSLVSMP